MDNNIPISDQAMRVILDEPYNFPSRAKDNLNAVRAGSKAYIEQKVEKTLEHYCITLSSQSIGGVSCLIARPRTLRSNWKIFYTFGGGFVSGSAYEDLTIAAPVSAITGVEVIIPEYRLAPEYPWPAACDDTMAVRSEEAHV